MPRLWLLVIAGGMGLSGYACGGSDSPAASPSPVPAAPTVSSLAIVGPRVVPLGSDVTYSATVTLMSGVQIPYARNTTWTSDNPDVATIRSALDGIGELTGKREGTAIITASYQGQTGTLSIDVRDGKRPLTGANLLISYSPDPVPGRSMQCSTTPALGIPTWTFNITITETVGVGFTLENLSFTLYDDGANPIYLDTFSEKDYFPPNSVVSEDFCTSLFGQPAGFYSDVYEGVDDLGNRRAFTRDRLRLLPVAASAASSFVPFAPHAAARGARRRIR